MKEKTATDSDKEDTIPIKDSDSGKSYESENTHKESKSKILDEKRESVAKKDYFYESSEIQNAGNKPTTWKRGKHFLKFVFSFAVFKKRSFCYICYGLFLWLCGSRPTNYIHTGYCKR